MSIGVRCTPIQNNPAKSLIVYLLPFFYKFEEFLLIVKVLELWLNRQRATETLN